VSEALPVAALEGVSYRYDGDVVLDGIDLALGAGERVVALGPNGGGKTTLLELLLGLRRPWRGSVLRVAARAAYVPQFPHFDRNFPIRVAEMVLEGRLDRSRRYDAADRRATESMLEQLDLARLGGAYLTELSGGEMKRALVARALVAAPDLLVLDEPTASLDEESRGQLWRLLAELPRQTTIVLATHDLAPETFAPTRAFFVDRGLRALTLDRFHAGGLLCGHGHD